MQDKLNAASQKFQSLIQSEFTRIDRMKAHKSKKPQSQDGHKTIGVMSGDGIGPLITKQALRVLEALIPEEIKSGKVRIKMIEGMTIERRAELMQSLPDDVLEMQAHAVDRCRQPRSMSGGGPAPMRGRDL
mgnify:CR=1 FL=1